MNFNTFLLTFGLNPDDFVDIPVEPIKIEGGFIYELEQVDGDRTCSICGSKDCYKKDYRYIEIRNNENALESNYLRIRKIRYKCNKCGKTFTKPLTGINSYNKIDNKTKDLIFNETLEPISFSSIARKYSVSISTVINIFDERAKIVPRRLMPEVICIDEIKFDDDPEHKYVTVITDFERKEIVDIIRSRQMSYLREYFSNIPLKEREKTKVFISDMYEAYDTICRQYFPNAIHIIDLFHVITQLTNAVNKIRTQVMNLNTEKGSVQYNFMKQHWKYFLCRKKMIPNKYYTVKATGEVFHYSDLVFECHNLRQDFYESYECLQDLLSYSTFFTYEESLKFILRIVSRLESTNNLMLYGVAKTYRKWRYEIANGFDKKSRYKKYTNAIAEGLNNQLKTIIKSAYGYHNFDRFRKRSMLIMTYSNKHKKKA